MTVFVQTLDSIFDGFAVCGFFRLPRLHFFASPSSSFSTFYCYSHWTMCLTCCRRVTSKTNATANANANDDCDVDCRWRWRWRWRWRLRAIATTRANRKWNVEYIFVFLQFPFPTNKQKRHKQTALITTIMTVITNNVLRQLNAKFLLLLLPPLLLPRSEMQQSNIMKKNRRDIIKGAKDHRFRFLYK